MKNSTKIQLGKNGPLVSKIGLGCMRMSSIWGGSTPDETESIATIHEALDSGINFLNTGDFYGAGHNEMLIGKAIKGRRDDAFISVKFGAIFHNGHWLGLDLRPIAIKNFINYSLTRLGIETIDLYQPSRMDDSVPVEDIIGTVADLVKEGKVRYIGVSEITADQLRKANETSPISALEIGYSLADRQIENDLLPTAKDLGIAVVAFANTAEGLLTGEMMAPLSDNDYRNHFSRFQGENLIDNLRKVEVLKQLASTKGYSPTQIAIAWVKEQGDQIMPLVSMSRRSRLPENIAAMDIVFTPEEMNTLNTTFAIGAIKGGYLFTTLMTSPAEILPGVIFYSYLSAERKEKVCFWNHHTLVLQVSGQFTLETSVQSISMTGGEMLLIGKNQLGTLNKTPVPGGNYETIVISLQEDLLRKIVLEEKLEADGKYIGPPNILIPTNEFLQGYFQSIVPYARSSGATMTDALGILKVKEGVKLLLLAMPSLRNFIFDFSEPHKIDLEKFMLSNYHFNVPLEKFAQLTGRSLASFKRDFQKAFGMAPRHWLQERRLTEASHLIGHKHQKPSAIYLDLGFESLSHFSHSFKKRFGKSPNEWVV